MGSSIRREDASVLESDQLTRMWYPWYCDWEQTLTVIQGCRGKRWVILLRNSNGNFDRYKRTYNNSDYRDYIPLHRILPHLPWYDDLTFWLTIRVELMLLAKAFEHGAGYLSLGPLLFFAWLSGLGGSAAFSGAIKAGKLSIKVITATILISCSRQ